MARYPVNNRGMARTDKNEAYRRFMAARMAGQSQQQAVAAAKENLKGGPSEEQAKAITEKFPPSTSDGVGNTDTSPAQERKSETATDAETTPVEDTAPVEAQPETVEESHAQEQEIQEEKEKPEGVAYGDIPNEDLEKYDVEVLRKVFIAISLTTPDGRWGKDRLIKAIRFERRNKERELAQFAEAKKQHDQSRG